jgi:hypothetical protein
MNFESQVTRKSDLPDFSDVSFTVHKLTEGRRLKIRLSLAEPNRRLRDLMAEKEAAEGKPPAEQLAIYTRVLADMQDVIDDQITPVWVRGLLVSIDGLTINGEPATVEALIEEGPRDLYREIAGVIGKEVGLTEKERGESAPPTTSNAQEDGRMNDTSAPPADA